jgi:ubiquinone/menaquinone biosynthesis C-methylase UbiE
VLRTAELAGKRVLYGATQALRVAWYTGHYVAGRRKMGPLTLPGEAPYAERSSGLDRERLKESFRELFRADWRNIAAGEYKLPVESKRLASPLKLARLSRDYLKDAGRVARRRVFNGHSEVLNGQDTDKYPRYFLQNFHFQSGGWLSEDSAARYDMQVETLFTGAAAAMRRQALPHIRRAIGARDPASVSLLDLGCGTGAFMEEIKHNWPRLQVTALDLSPAYLAKARERLRRRTNVSFVEAKAEETCLPGVAFDIVATAYLFHELPPAVRRAVAAEIARLLRPGGVLILVDTIQYGDEPGLDILLESFPRAFHEPYYDGFCREDLAALFASSGLALQMSQLAFLSKVCVLTKAVQA